MQTREQERALHIDGCLTKRLDVLEKYSDRLKGAPAEVMDNGLLQALAFFHSKGSPEKDSPEKDIAMDVGSWLRRRKLVSGPEASILNELAKMDSTKYRLCSEEAIAWLNLAKRLAAARCAMRGGS